MRKLLVDPHPYVTSSHKLFIYHYDAHYVKAIDELHDEVGRILTRHKYHGDIQIHEYFDPAMLTELLIDKLRGLTEHEEMVMDLLVDDFGEEISSDLVEVLANWVNMDLFPYGLREIVNGINNECYLIDITFDEDSDATYYSFDTAE